jgi:hypothetical protein
VGDWKVKTQEDAITASFSVNSGAASWWRYGAAIATGNTSAEVSGSVDIECSPSG